MDHKIEEIEGIGEVYAAKLREAGIFTTNNLFSLYADDIDQIANAIGIDLGMLLKWATLAGLMRVKGISSQYAELLYNADIKTTGELVDGDAEEILKKVNEANIVKSVVKRQIGIGIVAKWIEEAKKLSGLQ